MATSYSGICTLTSLESFIDTLKKQKFVITKDSVDSSDRDVTADHYTIEDRAHKLVASIMAVRLGVIITNYTLKMQSDKMSMGSLDDVDRSIAPQLYGISLIAPEKNEPLEGFINNISAAQRMIRDL